MSPSNPYIKKDTLMLDFQSPELWENKFLVFKPPSANISAMEKNIEHVKRD